MSNPTGIGAQYDQPDPRGILVFHGLPDDLQRAEDATQAHDYGSAGWTQHWDNEIKQWYAERPATDAERTLLAHLYGTIPDVLATRVQWVTDSIRRRTWPALDNATLEGNS